MLHQRRVKLTRRPVAGWRITWRYVPSSRLVVLLHLRHRRISGTRLGGWILWCRVLLHRLNLVIGSWHLSIAPLIAARVCSPHPTTAGSTTAATASPTTSLCCRRPFNLRSSLRRLHQDCRACSLRSAGASHNWMPLVLAPQFDAIKKWGMLEHFWKYNKADLRSTDISHF